LQESDRKNVSRGHQKAFIKNLKAPIVVAGVFFLKEKKKEEKIIMETKYGLMSDKCRRQSRRAEGRRGEELGQSISPKHN
jgi:hypothetical protein